MSVLATGYPSIDHILPVSHSPAVGETARLLAMPDSYTFGGCGANISVALARLGQRAGVAMVLGDDDYGASYLDHLAAHGVDTANCVRLPGQQTSQAYLFRNPEGQSQLFFYPGAADAWEGPLQLQGLEQYRYAVVTVGPLAYNRQFVQQVSAAGLPLIWVMKADIFAYPADTLREFLAHSRYVLMNHLEMHYVLAACGASTPAQLLSASTRAILVTRGAADIEIHTALQTRYVPTVPPAQSVDPTGAGDGFAAGFVMGLLRETPLAVCAQLGSVVASFVLEAVGCQTSLPTWEQVLARYAAHYGEFEYHP